ncbi:MAG: hypothetical protein QW743_02060 [Candidatus Methanomethylicia archaeon]
MNTNSARMMEDVKNGIKSKSIIQSIDRKLLNFINPINIGEYYD